MITDEIFLVKTQRTEQFFTSRRELAKGILQGYIALEPSPLVVRYERGPTNTQNDDIGPQLVRFHEDLPDYLMSNIYERKEITDALEDFISSVLQ